MHAASAARRLMTILVVFMVSGAQLSARADLPPSAGSCADTSVRSTQPLADDDAPRFRAGRAILFDIQQARQAIDEEYVLSAHESLVDARERLASLAELTPALSTSSLSTRPCDIDLSAIQVPIGWIPADATLETVVVHLPGAIAEVDARFRQPEWSTGRSRPPEETRPGRVRTTRLRLTIFPFAPVSEDIAEALRSVPVELPRWNESRRAVDHALSLIKTVTRLRDASLIDAYCDVFGAEQLAADNPVEARSSLRRAANRLAGDTTLADLARTLAALAKAEVLQAHAIDTASLKLYARITSRLCETETH